MSGLSRIFYADKPKVISAIKSDFAGTEEKHGKARLHHHVVINATGRDIEVIRSLWPHGDLVEAEQVDENDFASLASYITKDYICYQV